MAEHPDTGSGSDALASAEEKLASMFGGDEADDAAEESTQQAAPAESEQGNEAQADGEQSPDDASAQVEEEVDGVTMRGSKSAVEALKSERLMRADYTRKTQEAAQIAKQAEDRLQYVEAREQIMGTLLQDYTALQQQETKLQQLRAIDLEALYNANQGQAFAIQRQISDMEKQIADAKGAINGKAQNAQRMLDAHRAKQWELAEKGAIERIGQVSQADNVAMARQVAALGFTAEEVTGRFADPRFLHLVFKAAKWDALQGTKGQSLASASKAPPVVKPGAFDRNAQDKVSNMNWHKAMKNAKSSKERTGLAEARMSRFFGG